MSAMMTLQQVADWLSQAGLAVTTQGPMATPVSRVHTDTRTLQPGDLFVALKGERFDANHFLSEAKDRGASAALAHGGLGAAGLPGLEVADSRLALGQLAACWRAQFDLPLIAVTGSNGKTTVTQMIAAILRSWKQDAAFATEGNLNNGIGVPLTLLRLRETHAAAVVELGMNHPGEIAYLAGLASPTVALVNNAQREHLEFMATVQAVAHENGAVIDSLGAGGTAVFPLDDDYSSLWTRLASGRQRMTFSAPADRPLAADVTAQAKWTGEGWHVRMATPCGPVELALGIAGLHNVKNALAAAACALAAGAPLGCVGAGLGAFVPVKGRSRAFTLNIGSHRISAVDDTYNANPDSMRAAIDMLAALPGPQLLVMGDMGEVGTNGPAFHAEAGFYARERGVQNLFTLGEQSAGAAASFGPGRHFDHIDALNAALLEALPGIGSVLVKGSRFMKMERVLQALAAAAPVRQLNNNDEGRHHAA
ncbi:MAG: UDP-N-acetylmuramoyl-tripeptide--D-alanyl-D-alanine ligase [Polaromonas sp.]|jgi:UDP-N-acetylmuramoyl-tripeptide--D-alanyl-D-alanine ligase|nr:UDP-N-acetylmuramoyl-tripeptide--D-alanyl-D-alanine ligase [Polaromonas sp.]